MASAKQGVGAAHNEEKAMATNDDEILLTVFLKHQQTMPLADIDQRLDDTGFWKEFPPEDIEIVSWYVMMGIGQVVTLRVPAARLREVNLAIERCAWGAFSTEFYATYDFTPVAHSKRAAAK
jgi:hypothetical protein